MKDMEQFMCYVHPEPNSGCWLWIGSRDRHGHGQIHWSDAKKRTTKRAHRYAYEQVIGPVPAGLELDHLCRIRSCVNPRHLQAVTHRENCLRGISFAAENAQRTRAICGHPYDYVSGRKAIGRRCRQCHNAGQRRRYRHRRALNA